MARLAGIGARAPPVSLAATLGAFFKGESGRTVLPVTAETVGAAIQQVRSEYLPIPEDDVLWLDAIRQSNDSNIAAMEDVPRFSRLLDNHLAVGYRESSGEWYDVHPLISEFVRHRAVEIRGHGGVGHGRRQ